MGICAHQFETPSQCLPSIVHCALRVGFGVQVGIVETGRREPGRDVVISFSLRLFHTCRRPSTTRLASHSLDVPLPLGSSTTRRAPRRNGLVCCCSLAALPARRGSRGCHARSAHSSAQMSSLVFDLELLSESRQPNHGQNPHRHFGIPLQASEATMFQARPWTEGSSMSCPVPTMYLM